MISNFGLDDRHVAHRERVRKFCDEQIRPVVDDYEERGEFPLDVVDELGEAGLYGINVPEEYGGAGLDFRSFVVTVEELARVWKIPAGVVSLSCSLFANTIEKYGTDWQREEWLRGLFTDNGVAAISLTEPQAGSDASAIETTATRDGDEYVIDGHKVWTSHGAVADIVLVVARTGDDGTHDDVSIIAVPEPHDRDGFEIVRDIPCMEGDAVVESEIAYDGLRVPTDYLLGEEGQGFRYIMEALDIGRIGAAAQAVGISQGAFDECISFADEREAFGRSIRQFQGVSFKLADMQMGIDASRLLTYRAASALDRGADRVTQPAAMAKTFASDTAMDVTTEAVQIHGSRGYSRDYPLERYMREAKGIQIYEGTNEVNRHVIAKNLYE
ncbi:acyl-CoA dehydrogenase family protein [Haloarchaeobius sp. DFWS5]|uniref:acyl-CoA dehydrogenase family protein n=1 Tax=Haloarchaeobius sp. DFWS5 TaxID=3446114 RepID=UPI003EB7C220